MYSHMQKDMAVCYTLTPYNLPFLRTYIKNYNKEPRRNSELPNRRSKGFSLRAGAGGRGLGVRVGKFRVGKEETHFRVYVTVWLGAAER